MAYGGWHYGLGRFGVGAVEASATIAAQSQVQARATVQAWGRAEFYNASSVTADPQLVANASASIVDQSTGTAHAVNLASADAAIQSVSSAAARAEAEYSSSAAISSVSTASAAIIRIKDAETQASSESGGIVYGQGAFGGGQFGNRDVDAIRIRNTQALLTDTSSASGTAYATRGVGALIQSDSALTAQAVFIVVARGTAAAESNLTVAYVRERNVQAAGQEQSSFTASAREKWIEEEDTPEFWTPVPETSEIWTPNTSRY